MAGATLTVAGLPFDLNYKGENLMNKSDVGRLARKLFTLFALAACLLLVRGNQVALAAQSYCDWDWEDADTCLIQGNFWYPRCCVCADAAVVMACEDTEHWYDACTGRCRVIQQ
jgi:hypothetical protein